MKIRLIGTMSKMEFVIVTRFFIDFNIKYSVDVKEIKVINHDYSEITVEINFTCNQEVEKFTVMPYGQGENTEVNVQFKDYGLGFLFKELILSQMI